jgi:ribosomal 30S subunit maturation factor RimM
MALVATGCFLSPRGIKGEAFVEIYQKCKFLPKNGEKAYLKENNAFIPFVVEKFFSYEKGSVLKFAEISAKEDADKLKGKEFFLEREEEPDFLGSEIIGFEVYDLKRGKIGEIYDFAVLSPYILLICKGEMRSFQIPLVKELGYKLSVKEKRVFFDLPEDYPGVDYEN